MSKHLHNHWSHLLIWGAMVLYLILGPEIYDHFFVQEGKPIQTNVKLPTQVYGSKSAMDRVEIVDDQRGIHQLLGWAFLTVGKNIPVEDYERQVVLITSKGNYIFAATTLKRIDVQLTYRDLGMDVVNSGFSALIDRNALELGLFRLGIIFRRISNDSAYYVFTDYCIKHTPNQLIMENINDSSCRSLIFQGTGQPIQSNTEMPIETREARSGVDRLDATEEKGIFKISGWAFLTVDKDIPAGDYERQIVLSTTSGNYIITADSVTRTDVQEYFSDLGMDLTTSGFSALIDSRILNPGVYDIGVIFKQTASDMAYYVNIHRCLTRTVDKLVLEMPGSSACSIP